MNFIFVNRKKMTSKIIFTTLVPHINSLRIFKIKYTAELEPIMNKRKYNFIFKRC